MVRKLIILLYLFCAITLGLSGSEKDVFNTEGELPQWVRKVVRSDLTRSNSSRLVRYQIDRLSVSDPSIVELDQLDSREKKALLSFISAVHNSDGKQLLTLWPDYDVGKSENWFENKVRFFRDYDDAQFFGYHIEYEASKYVYMEYLLFSKSAGIVEEKSVTFKYSHDLSDYTIFEM